MAAFALGFVALAVGDGEPDLTVTPLARDGQVLVSFELSDGLTPEVRDAIQSGLATTFSYEVELRRGTATWFDRTIAAFVIGTVLLIPLSITEKIVSMGTRKTSIDDFMGKATPQRDTGSRRGW